MNAERIISAILEDDLTPEEFLRSFDLSDIKIAEEPTETDGVPVHRVQLRTEFGFQGIGYICKDMHWRQGWKAYEVFSQRKRDNYAGRYYLNGEWFKTPEEAAIDLKKRWQKT